MRDLQFGDHPDQDWANWGFELTCAAFGPFSRMAAIIHMYLEDKALMDYEELEKGDPNLWDWDQSWKNGGRNLKLGQEISALCCNIR